MSVDFQEPVYISFAVHYADLLALLVYLCFEAILLSILYVFSIISLIEDFRANKFLHSLVQTRVEFQVLVSSLIVNKKNVLDLNLSFAFDHLKINCDSNVFYGVIQCDENVLAVFQRNENNGNRDLL